MTENPSVAPVRLRVDAARGGVVTVVIEGRLDSNTTGKIWRRAAETVTATKASNIVVDASAIDYCDGAGIALLVHLRDLKHKSGGQLAIHLSCTIDSLFKRSDSVRLKK
jgi:phospholipid/cholesterol/gamma-HCH transport system permease protein